MATQNLFEKYGIKEVADVTFYRIEKKEETYESQRTITAASILKGALELRTVYPINNMGVGDEEGFEAYVFTDADLISGTNYDCDDSKEVTVKFTFTYDESRDEAGAGGASTKSIAGIKAYVETNLDKIVTAALDGETEYVEKTTGLDETVTEKKTGIVGMSLVLRDASNLPVGIKYVADNVDSDSFPEEISITTISDRSRKVETPDGTITRTIADFKTTFKITTVDSAQLSTGIYNNNNSGESDPDYTGAGTHEYTYAQQVCMLFAKRQNLIAKTGVRYIFEDADTLFGDIDFSDDFAPAAYSDEKIVVVGLAGKFDEGAYDLDEVNEAIAKLTSSIKAKAYDVTYADYAELVVEDEMGYYNPTFLGTDYVRIDGAGVLSTTFATGNAYIDYLKSYGKEYDAALAHAEMWGDNLHYSINDAIDALKQKRLILDASEESGMAGVAGIFGGYKIRSYEKDVADPIVGSEDTDTNNGNNKYQYKYTDGSSLAIAKNGDNEEINSKYPLAEVLNAVNEIGYINDIVGKELRVETISGALPSNRAIYIRVDSQVDTAAGAYIYLLHNKNANRLALDKDGIFKFNDKKGNTLYYQDKIFKGVEWLALVILGNKGLIFVVNRHGNKSVTRSAWMVNQNGYIDNNRAKVLVNNGLIHTTDITVNDETFEATCTVSGLKVHKTKKKANRYVPVLFLDTLKVSTIEQTAEEVYATGGKGNANLIGWDYGKEITLTLQDALFTPASMSAIFGTYEGNDFRKGVKETKSIDRMEKCTAKRNFIVPAGNMNGTPSEADKTAQAVYYDPNTMEPYADGTPIAEGEVFYKWTRSVAYEGQSLGHTIEISADSFPGTYKVVGDTFVRSKETGEDERFQFVVPQAKMTSEQTITLEADGDPTVDVIFTNAVVKIA